jgi:hypothetical protein
MSRSVLDTLINDLAKETKRCISWSPASRKKHLANTAIMFVTCAAIDLGENPATMRDLEQSLLAAIAKVRGKGSGP